ncbi:hypothetical protein R5R35_003874 [Gryllus longicercus]|uniref:Cytosol aminopeptidase n=1 Tax=Gryllus longicercus TaxID=2509291 RepID=A0AAN9YUX6_9ORTH
MAARYRLFSSIYRILVSPRRFLSGIPPCTPEEGTTKAICGANRTPTGLVLGVFTSMNAAGVCTSVRLTHAAERFNEATCGRLVEAIKAGGRPPLKGEARLLFDLHPDFGAVAAVGLGEECAGWDETEEIDHGKEDIRNAAALGVRKLQKLGVSKIQVESFGHAESSAEGAALGMWRFQEFKNKRSQLPMPPLELHNDCDYTGWTIGLEKASAQNLARQLTDMPANLLTPTFFAQRAVDILCNSGINVEIKVQGWAETQKMGAFLSVAKGSCEPPIFLELSYYGASYDERPIVLVGSGVTYDSGGLCLKHPKELVHMRGSMAGAAVVVATTRALAAMHMPINIRGLIPLCENMPGCNSYKPGDIVTAMNGKSIRVQSTDMEARLVLADALYYAQNFWPRFIIDVGTLTREAEQSLGGACAAVFTNSDFLWDSLHMSGVHTGDRVWRMPLWRHYSRQVLKSASTDMKNVGLDEGGLCKAAAFLREFVPCGEWMHIDVRGIFRTNGHENHYLHKGMSGRPTRTLIEFISQMICKYCPSLTKSHA